MTKSNLVLTVSFLFGAIKTTHAVSACTDFSANLQSCNGINSSIKALENEGQNTLEILATITYYNLARFDTQEKTITFFLALDTQWNDSSLILTNAG